MKNAYVLLSLFISAGAAAQSGFQKYFSEPIEFQEFSFSPSDSSYILAGSRFNAGTVYDFSVVKVSAGGNVLWSKTYPSPNDDFLTSVSVSPSGDILLNGYRSNTAGDNDFTLMKLDASGTLQWYRSYGTSAMEVSVCAGTNASGDIFLTGNRDITQLPVVTKMSSTGAVLWSKTFGTTAGGEEGQVAGVASDGGFVLAGELSGQKYFVKKLNADGTSAWAHTYTSTHPQFLASIRQTRDKGFALASTDYRCDLSGCHAYFSFIKLDSSGNISWAKAVEGFLGWGRNGMETADGGFVFTGQLQGPSSANAVLIKTDSNGSLLWTKAYGNAAAGESFFTEQIPDGGFVLSGIENSMGLLIRTDANGNAGCNEKNISPTLSDISFLKSTPFIAPETTPADAMDQPSCTETTFSVTDSLVCTPLGILPAAGEKNIMFFPNPLRRSDRLAVKGIEVGGPIRCVLYNTLGGKVLEETISAADPTIAAGNLLPGLYVVKITYGREAITRKLVIE